MNKMASLAEQTFRGFTDSDVTLIVLALNSGARFRSDILDAGLAQQATAAAVDLVTHELRRRELDVFGQAGKLLARLLDQMPKSALQSEDASEK